MIPQIIHLYEERCAVTSTSDLGAILTNKNDISVFWGIFSTMIIYILLSMFLC